MGQTRKSSRVTEIQQMERIEYHLNQPSTSTSSRIWTEEELDSLNWYFAQAKDMRNPVEEIMRHFDENGLAKRKLKDIVDQLLLQGLISNEEATVYCSPNSQHPELASDDTPSEKSEKQDSHTTDDVQFLTQKLLQECPMSIFWLQRVLLECSFIKKRIEEGVRCNREMIHECSAGQPLIMEPIALINICE